MFNKVILLGNLTRDIEVRFTASNLAIGNTGMATNRKFKNNMGEEKGEVMFLDITFFGRTAEIANQYLKRGSKILVDGRLKLDQWTDKSGQKRSKHSLVVESMKMLGNKQDESFSSQHTSAEKQPEVTANGGTNYGTELSIDSDEAIPF